MYRRVSCSCRPTNGRKNERARAHDERDPPAVVAQVGEGQKDHSERDADAEREREHRGGEGPGALGRFFDRGDAGDDEARVHERPGEELRAGEDLERRRQTGDEVGHARAGQREEDQLAAPEPVGERDHHQRHQHADPGDREREAERGVVLVERVA